MSQTHSSSFAKALQASGRLACGRVPCKTVLNGGRRRSLSCVLPRVLLRVVPCLIALLCFVCASTPKVWAAFPLSATLAASDTQPISWIGTATGPANTSSVATCREGFDCDTFILTIGGATSDWAGKVARIRIDWSLPASDFDLYLLKETANGNVVVGQSTHNPVSSQETHETVTFSPSSVGTGEFLVRVMYTAANFQDQYRAVAAVSTLIRQGVTNGKIAFTHQPNFSDSQISIVNPDGSNLQQLTALGSSNLRPVWSPDGSKIAFNSSRDGSAGLYVMNADGSNPVKVAGFVPLHAPTWSPDSTKLAYDAYVVHHYEIYVVNADGSNNKQLTVGLKDNLAPAWSPDGSKIAFESFRDGTNLTIYVMDADGANQLRLTDPSLISAFPVWSPDGAKIAYQSGSIYVMNPDGSNKTRLTSGSSQDSHAVWSPDGTKLAFDRSSDIYTVKADGSSLTRLTTDPSADLEPVWSPDGSKIAFESFRSGAYEVYTMNADGTNQMRLTFTNGIGASGTAWQAQ